MTEKEKVVFQTRSRTVTLPKYNQEEYSDSEDEDYEPSSGSEEEEEELVGKKRSTNTRGGKNTPKKQKVIDLDAEVIDLDNEDEKKDNVNKIWEDMNKENNNNNNSKNDIKVDNGNNNNNEKSDHFIDNNQNNKTSTIEIQENNIDKKSENKNIIDNNTLTDTSTTTDNTATTATAQRESASAATQQKPQETEIVEFAGEKIEIKKPAQPKPMTIKKKGGLDNLLSNLSKPKKINTLEKSKLDWDKFKNQDLNESEKHAIEQQKKDGYLEKEAFLQRTGENQHQEKLNLLKKLNK